MKTLSPSYRTGDLEKILVSEESISNRVEELAGELSAIYENRDVTVVSILSGALVFTADLLRQLEFPTRLDCLRAESYGNTTESQSPPRITNPLKTDVEGKHVLVVDDILDSGRTLQSIVEYLKQAKPASLKTCVLLDKKERRKVAIDADFVGFEIQDAFVVGYGLDFAERYRNLPCIGILKQAFQEAAAHRV